MRQAVADRDWYAVLEVSPEASAEVIAAAYRVLAKRYHPDVQGGDAETMKAVNAARDVLCDARSRREFDRLRQPAAPFVEPVRPWSPPSSTPRPSSSPEPAPAVVVPSVASPVVFSAFRERAELVLGHLVLGVRIAFGLLLAYAALELVLGIVWLVWTLATR